jgi:hypothetical protein
VARPRVPGKGAGMLFRAIRSFSAVFPAITFAALIGWSSVVQAADDEIGSVQTCVPLRQIDDSRVIDDKTIVLRVIDGSPYRRIDLAHECPGLTMAESFTSATTISQLCQRDILRLTQQPIGSQCIIDKIVVIDEAEAKALLARRKK